MATKQVMVVASFHCDVVWRRPPEEQVAIRDRQFTSALDMLAKRPEFRFEFDQASIMREYVEAHPERLQQMRELISEGRLDITGGEEAIPDTNMVSGEGLVRNIFLGRLWFQEQLKAHPVVANLDDAFGLNPQLPQIFKDFGYQYFRDARTPGLDPKVGAKGILWEGLDGSRIFYLPGHGYLEEHNAVCNLPMVYTPQERARYSLNAAMNIDVPVVYCKYCSEEDLVKEETLDLVLNLPRPDGVKMRFALARETLAEALMHNPSPTVVKGEFNPSQPGTQITRISLKKAYRRAEWETIVAEAAATCATLTGASYPKDQLVEMWRKLSYVQFHDSLCGCHTDEVNRKVMGYCREISRSGKTMSYRALRALSLRRGSCSGLIAFNPLLVSRREPMLLPLSEGTTLADAEGKPLVAERHGNKILVVADLPPLGLRQWPIVKTRLPKQTVTPGSRIKGKSFNAGPYRVTARDNGIKIENEIWNRTLVDGNFPQVRFRLEDGTLWDERFLGSTLNDEAGTSQLVHREEGPVSVRLVWQGEAMGEPSADPMPPSWKELRNGKPIVFADLKSLHWEKELVFYRELNRIDATLRFDFKGRNTEILIGFPLQLDLSQTKAIYDVPFGAVERRPYYEIPAASPEIKSAPFHLAKLAGMGAWAALGWVAYGDNMWGMVLANRGTPSHRLMSGMIEVGVLRSPTTKGSAFSVPESAHENGKHEFQFALTPYLGDHREKGAYQLGACFNASPLLRATKIDPTAETTHSFLSLTASGVALSALKKAERGEGYVLRTYETEGRQAKGKLTTAFPLTKVQELDLMEKPVREVDPNRLTWKPFEIKTLLLEA